MVDDVTIRPALAADYDAIVRLWSDSGLPSSLQGRDGREPFRRQVDAFPTTYLVAEQGSRIVGVVLGTHDWRKGWINRLAIHPDHQRQGIARRLIAACEQAFVDLGIEIFAALVEPDNEVSSQVFQRCGYAHDFPVLYLRKRLRDDI